MSFGFFSGINKKRNEDESDIMYVIAGLGNPTEKYSKTRHNVGFDTLDLLAEAYQIQLKTKKCNALCGSGIIDGKRVLLAKPQTYMNNSGEAIAALLNFYKLDAATGLLVIYDDISLEEGSIRIRKKGSAGGHNGIKSIIAHTGTQEFARIKIGVGEKPKEWDLADYVLGRFDQKTRALVEDAMKDAVLAAAMILAGDADKAMNCFNAKKKNKLNSY